MATRVRNFIRTFGDFTSAFSVRWFVLVGIVLGVPLTIGGYFVTGAAAQIILFMTGVSCAVFSSYWVWRVENEARHKAEALVYHPLIDIERSCLFLDPTGWKAKIIPRKKVTSVQVCLDTSAYSGGVGYNFWNPKGRSILIRDINFVVGAAVSIDLMELDSSSPTRFWRWATDTDGGERPLVLLTCHRCQLVLIAEQEAPDFFDFIVTFHYEERPLQLVTGKHPLYMKRHLH
jgi:hypothetical protein